jgi:signal transduction histidine kinase/CheY-like chemotaxis protein
LFFCALLFALGLSVIAGWLLAIEPLKSVLPGLSTMKFNTALGFVLVGVAFALAGRESRRGRQLAVASGSLLILIAVLTLLQYLARLNLGIDELAVRDTGTLRGSGFPGRMSPLTATAWIALGATAILTAVGRRRVSIIAAHVLAGYAGFVAFLAAAGYAFGAEAFWGIGFYTAMAIHTALGLLIAVAAALITRADEGWLGGFRDSPDARALLVQLLPIAVVLPTGLGFLLLFASGLGAFNAPFGFAFFVPSSVLALVAVVLRVASKARNNELALRASETALRASEERLSTALAIAQLGTFSWDTGTDRIDLDRRSREIFNFDPSEGHDAQDLFDRVHPDDLQRVLAEARGSRDHLTRLETEYRIMLPDNSIRTIVSLSDVDASGAAVRIFGVFGDISERKRLEADLRHLNETLEERVRERSEELERVHEQLRQSQKLEAMGQLTGGVAHDFNNLLSPIIGSLDLIQRKGLGDQKSKRLVEGALASAERAKNLVQRLLAFARRQPLQTAAVDVSRLLEEMADLVAATSGPRIRLDVDLQPDLPAASADANQLEMAILNLAVNARDAMPDGGTLTISAAAEDVAAGDPDLGPGAYVRITVADTGLGMDEETMQRAIEPFFSTKGVGRGTGLGLSMVHGLAAQLGGALRLDSRPGLGTKVELLLPVSPEAEPAEGAFAEGDSAAGSGIALLVDDEEMVRASTAAMLIDLGYQVREAASAEEALQLLGDDGLRPTLLVTDHLMPGMTGAELARNVQVDHPELPILVISGYAEVDEIAPDLPRLAKPFRQADMAAALAGLARTVA